MIFQKTKQEWEKAGGYHTANEIYQQPGTWLKTYQLIVQKKKEIDAFIRPVTENEVFEIIFAGAGTSEFIGNALACTLQKEYKHNVKSCPTTDITSDPQTCLSHDKPTLLVSFGRSGNSPESVASVHMADQLCTNVRHLMITCNENGAMAEYAKGKENCYVITLPFETNDQAFAMTSSFTNMYLAAWLSLQKNDISRYEDPVKEIARCGRQFLEEGYKQAEDLVQEYPFDRIVCLGAGSLKGFAQEAALKVCELTQGKVDTVFNSPMGFRHGPKSVIKDTALTLVFLSEDPYTREYEYDLIKEMHHEKKGNKIYVVSMRENRIRKETDGMFVIRHCQHVPSALAGLNAILVGQVIALFKSMQCSVMPDNPCPSGEVNRVVKGVIIHPFIEEGTSV